MIDECGELINQSVGGFDIESSRYTRGNRTKVQQSRVGHLLLVGFFMLKFKLKVS